jgi:hypothetical protein
MSALGTSGCWGINVKAPPRDMGSTGNASAANTDISFLEVGKTTREDVEQRLGWANAQLGNDRIFLARWLHSERDTIWISGYVPVGGDRRWEARNVLVEFDAAGVVTKSTQVGDVELLSELARAAGRAELPGVPSLSPQQAIAKRVFSHAPGADPGFVTHDCTLMISDAKLELTEKLTKKTEVWFSASPPEIASITGSKGHSVMLTDGEPSADAAKIMIQLRFSHSFHVGKSVALELSGADTLALARVLSRAGFPK